MTATMALWLLGCIPTYQDLPDTGTPAAVSNAAPEAEVLGEERSGGPLDPVLFRVSDADQAPVTLRVELSSDIDGVLVTGNPSGGGEVSYSGGLTFGEHYLILEVEDAAGAVTRADLVWTVVGDNQPPICAILSPSPDQVFTTDESVLMLGEGEDPEGGTVTYLWSSSLFGALAFGPEFEALLPEGEHALELKVTDAAGAECVETVVIRVVQP